MTTRTAAEALEEVLAQIAAVDGLSGMDRLEARLDSANAARNFIMKHAATLRAALAQPQEGGSSETPRYDALEPRHKDWDDQGANWSRVKIDELLCDTLSALFDSETELTRLLRATQAQPLTDAQIVEIRDDHLPSQGEPFDCLAFARAVLRATQSNGHSPEVRSALEPTGKDLDHSPTAQAGYGGLENGNRHQTVPAGESPAQSAPVQEPTITVSGPVACGKSYVMELIYKALRDAGLHPYSNELAHERRMVEEQPQPPAKVWKLREAVYAAPPPDEARELLLLGELQNIVNAKRFAREAFSSDTEFADWAQSRARHTLAIYAEEKHK